MARYKQQSNLKNVFYKNTFMYKKNTLMYKFKAVIVFYSIVHQRVNLKFGLLFFCIALYLPNFQ